MNDKIASPSDETGNPPADGETREQWQIAVIGLPNSGKSTFLARLYGANIGNATDSTDDLFALSFPPTSDPEENEARAKYKERWKWICSNFERKHETIDNAGLCFNIAGPGLSKDIKVFARALPAETFQLPDNLHSGSIAPDTLEQYRNACRRKHRHLHGAVILIDSARAGDPESTALVKSMLDFLPTRNQHRKPVFKLVVFTKAAAITGAHDLRETIQNLETQWRGQGQRWLRVVACEAIRDLRKTTGSDGRVHGTLPQPGKPDSAAGIPEWIRTPSSAMLEFPRMLTAFNQYCRRHKRIAAAAVMAVLAGLWGAHGYRHDGRTFRAAIDAPPAQRAIALETYITTFGGSLRNMLYPFRHRIEPAILQWNASYFDEYMAHLDLETRIAELDNVQDRKIWRHHQSELYESAVADTLAAMREQETYFDRVINEWKQDAYQAENPDSVIESRTFVFTRMPSMIDRAENRRRELSDDYDRTRRQTQAFSATANRWQDATERLILELETMARQPPLLFRNLRETRAADLRNLANTVDFSGREHAPFQFKRLLNALDSAIASHIGTDRHERRQVRELRRDMQDIIIGLQQRSESLYSKFNQARYWIEKKGYADQAVDILRDLPESADWRKRQTEWDRKLSISEQSYNEMTAREQAADDDPIKQHDIVREFADSRDAEIAPDHRHLGVERAAVLQMQIEELQNAWEQVETAFIEFSDDATLWLRVMEAIHDYDRLLFAQNRKRIQDHANRFSEIRQRVDAERLRVASLLAAHQQLLPDMRHHDSERRKTVRRQLADVLQQLDASYERENNRQRIDDWLTDIRGFVAAINEQTSTDAEFAEALDALRLVAETAEIFQTTEQKSQWSLAMTGKIQTLWADKHWNNAKRDADDDARRQRFPVSVERLRRYRDQRETPYEIYEHYADLEIERHTDTWSHVLEDAIRGLIEPSFSQREDYTERLAQIDHWLDEFQSISDAPATLRDRQQTAHETLKEMLFSWHTERIDTLLNALPEHSGGHRILTTWDQIETLRDLFDDLKDDPVIQAFDQSAKTKCIRSIERLDRLYRRRIFTITFSDMRVVMPNDAAYWTRNKFPQPALRLLVAEQPLWHVQLEKHEQDNTALDSQNRTRLYRVVEEQESAQYIVTGTDWTPQRDTIRYEKDYAIDLTVQVARQTGSPLRLPLVTPANTPGYLLANIQHTAATDLKYRPLARRARTMRVVVETTVQATGLDAFMVPPLFEQW